VDAKGVLFELSASSEHLLGVSCIDSKRVVVIPEQPLDRPRPREHLAVKGRVVAVDDREADREERGDGGRGTRFCLDRDGKDDAPGADADRTQLSTGADEPR
jgi:hypothetical protein